MEQWRYIEYICVDEGNVTTNSIGDVHQVELRNEKDIKNFEYPSQIKRNLGFGPCRR